MEENNVQKDENKLPLPRKNVMAKPNLIIDGKRAKAKINKLETENIQLKQRLLKLEKLMKMSVTENNNNEQLLNANKFNVLLDNHDMDEDEWILNNNEDASIEENLKQSLKRKNTQLPQKNVKKAAIGVKLNTGKEHNIEKNVIPKKLERPPPINIHYQEVNDTIKLLKECSINNFEIKRVNKTKHTIITKSINDFNKTNEALKEVNTPYFTYTSKSMKPKSLVLKGLNENEDLNEIKGEIEEKAMVKIAKIIPMKSKRKITNERYANLPFFIVQFNHDTILSQVHAIKIINYQRVKWESLRNQDLVMQCKNCQRFGHAAVNCHLNYRCVKCANIHKPGECQINSNLEQKEIYCTNCQNFGHPASFKGCPIYKKMVENLKNRIKSKQNRNTVESRTFSSTPVNKENGSFADMLKGKPNNDIPVQQLTARLDKMERIIMQQSEQIAQLLKVISSLDE